jgi:hypothetical protein
MTFSKGTVWKMTDVVVLAIREKLALLKNSIEGQPDTFHRGLRKEMEISKDALDQARSLYEFNKNWLDKTLKEKEELERWLEEHGIEQE